MLRRAATLRELHTSTASSPSMRAMKHAGPLPGVLHSPYKDALKEYWATPIPWQPREYGHKPEPGDPVPMRQSATTVMVARNKHIDQGLVEAGEDNDYKVLMQFREAKGRFQKDQFVFPGAPVNLQDRDEDWAPLLHRLGVREEFQDIDERICAVRSLLAECNLLAIPPEGGGVAEVEGPPGPRKWHMIVASIPEQMRYLVDILDIPMEPALKQLRPFNSIHTPGTEMFRYDNKTFLLPIEKVPCVKYTISTVGEQLVWVSPKEALARFETGVMEMPTPNVILMHELERRCPRFEDISSMDWNNPTPEIVKPELIHDPATYMATVLLPTDVHYSANAKRAERRKRRQEARRAAKEAEEAGQPAPSPPAEEPLAEGESNVDRFARFEFTKDIPWGVRSTFINRPIALDEEVAETFERSKELTAAEAEVLRLEFREENNRAIERKLRKAQSPEMRRMVELLPEKEKSFTVERIPADGKKE
jgi:hypothetical protein